MTSTLNGRVLHIGKFYPPYRGGMESFLSDLIDEQRRQGLYAMGLVHGQPLHGDPSWLYRVRVQTQVLYAPIGIGFPFKLRRLLREFEPDIVHLHMPNNAVFWALLMRSARRVPWIIHWQSDVVPSRIRKALSAAYALYQPFETAMLRRASAVIVTSPDYLEASAPLQAWRGKCKVIPLGVKRLPPELRAPTNQTAASEWRPGVLRLLSLGRLTYYKGFETLIRAVAPLPNVELLIAGEGLMRADLAALIRECTPPTAVPTVKLLGSVDEERKHRLLSECDVFCLASRERTEAFGIVLIEAMQHARPCLVSDLPGSGMPWAVRESGGGLLVPLDDVAGWRQAITRLHSDAGLRARLGAAGLAAADKLFSIETCAREIARCYVTTSRDVRRLVNPKDTLIAMVMSDAARLSSSRILALQQGGWQDILVVEYGGSEEPCPPAHTADCIVMRPALRTTTGGAVQTALRYALDQGYQRVITIDEGHMPSAADLQSLSQALEHGDDAPDVAVGTLAARGQRTRPSWITRLTGIDIAHRGALLRAYNHDALVVCASREATLLDHEDIGALVLIHKARLKIAELPLDPPETPNTCSKKSGWFKAWAEVMATFVLCVSNWDRRHARRRPRDDQGVQADMTRL